MPKTLIASNLDGPVGEYQKLTSVAIRQIARQQKLDAAALQRGLKRAGEFKVGVRELVERLVREFPWPCFAVVINYVLTLTQMIIAGGYAWVDDNITVANFPISGGGKVKRDLYLVGFDRNMSSEAILRWLDQHGLRAGAIEDLLALGGKFPNEQLQGPIVALGSSVMLRGSRYVPCLGRDDRWRGLFLFYFEFDWFQDYRFLAVRKGS